MPRYIEAILKRFHHLRPIKPELAPHCTRRTPEASRRAVLSSGMGAWALAALKEQEAYWWEAIYGLVGRG